MLPDIDGLYIKDKWVMPVDKLSLSYQSNDLSKPTTLQTNFSRSFKLPNDVATSKLLEYSEQLDSTSRLPYQLIPAFIVSGGELVFDGVIRFANYSAGWEVELKELKSDLYTRLDRSIRTANLNRFDHKWSIEAINQLSTSVDGVCYPAIDYGLIEGGVVPADSLFPAIYVKTLIAQLLKEEGYVLTGKLTDDPMYRALAIPFVESEPTAQDEDWRKERTAIVSLDTGQDDSVSRTIFGRAAWLDRVQPFDIDNRARNGLSQGRMQNYDVTSYTYVCDVQMRVQVQATQTLKLKCITGSVEAALIVEKNGREVGKAYMNTGSGYNLLMMRTDQLNLDTTVDCEAGDRLQIRLQVNRQTRTGAWEAEVYNNPDNARVSFTPKIELATNGNWVVARNLPDIKALDLLKNVAYIYSGSWEVDSLRREIRLNRLSETISNIEQAIDWSTRIDDSELMQWDPTLDPYAQRNLLKWKDSDETKRGKDGLLFKIPYGDGLIRANTDTADAEEPLFEMAFAATTNSVNSIANYGNPLFIKTRTVTGSGDNLSINKQSTAPRLILIHPEQLVSLPATRLAADGQTVESPQVNLKACWFGTRTESIVSPNTAYSLCYAEVVGNRGEKCLIEANYSGLRKILRKMQVLTISLKLLPSDISQLDFSRLVKLNRVQVGNNIFTNTHWYVNTISDYGADGKAKAKLIGFRDLVDNSDIA